MKVLEQCPLFNQAALDSGHNVHRPQRRVMAAPSEGSVLAPSKKRGHSMKTQHSKCSEQYRKTWSSVRMYIMFGCCGELLAAAVAVIPTIDSQIMDAALPDLFIQEVGARPDSATRLQRNTKIHIIFKMKLTLKFFVLTQKNIIILPVPLPFNKNKNNNNKLR